MVVLDKPTYDKIFKEVPTFKMISQSVLIDRMKINGSLARVAIRHLERDGLIKKVVHHHGQLVYSEYLMHVAQINFNQVYMRLIIAFFLLRLDSPSCYRL